MGGNKPFFQRTCVPDKFDDTGLGGEGYDSVVPYPEISLACIAVSINNGVHEFENLLHDCILAQIVLSFALELGAEMSD